MAGSVDPVASAARTRATTASWARASAVRAEDAEKASAPNRSVWPGSCAMSLMAPRKADSPSARSPVLSAAGSESATPTVVIFALRLPPASTRAAGKALLRAWGVRMIGSAVPVPSMARTAVAWACALPAITTQSTLPAPAAAVRASVMGLVSAPSL